MKQNIWEKEYKNVDSLWGFNPNSILSQYVEMLPENGEVLDIGMGEGRNALFFANTLDNELDIVLNFCTIDDLRSENGKVKTFLCNLQSI